MDVVTIPGNTMLDLAAAITAKLQENFQIIPTLTLDQAAKELGISNEKMRQLCNDGEIPFIRMDRLYRIKPADVNAYLARNYHGKTGDNAGR